MPWETCTAPEHLLDLDFLKRYTSGTHGVGKFIAEITAIREGKTSVHFCDPLTLAIAIDPSIITYASERKGVVELQGTKTRGMTVINWGSSDMKAVNETTPNLVIIEKINLETVKDLLLRSIGN